MCAKAATASSPNTKKFYVAIYADPYLAVPLQIWQVYLHAINRIDVTCTQGQTNRFSLILKYELIITYVNGSMLVSLTNRAM